MVTNRLCSKTRIWASERLHFFQFSHQKHNALIPIFFEKKRPWVLCVLNHECRKSKINANIDVFFTVFSEKNGHESGVFLAKNVQNQKYATISTSFCTGFVQRIWQVWSREFHWSRLRNFTGWGGEGLLGFWVRGYGSFYLRWTL